MRTRSRSGLAGALGLTGVGLCIVTLAVAQPGGGGLVPPAVPSVPLARAQWGASFGGERVFTKPKQDAAMGFTLSTQIMEITCRAGDHVSAGQLLVRGDDREEASRYVQQVHRADSVLQIERARAAADLSEIEYNRNLEALQGGAANDLEVDRSRLAMVTAKIDVQIAEWSQQQERYLAELTQARVDRFRLVAPFEGIVDVVNVDLGDVVRETDPVVRVVDLSEIWLDVPTSPQDVLAMGVVKDSPAWVMVELSDHPLVVRGRVIYVSPTTDGPSGRHTVRVSVANTGNWPSGLSAWVRFQEPSSEWMGLLATGEAAGDVSEGAAEMATAAVGAGSGEAGR